MIEFEDDEGSPKRGHPTSKPRTVRLTTDELQEIVAAGVKETLLQLGMDTENPLEMQRDFQHLRQWRRAGEDLRAKSMGALLAIMISGAAAAVWVGFKDALHH